MFSRIIILTLILFAWFTPVFAESHHPQQFLKQIDGSKDEGEQIYRYICVNCHSEKPLIALGAPRIGNKNDWKKRLKQGLATLFKHTEEGYNGMPQRGGCFECTDQQLILAILVLVPEAAKRDILNQLKDHKKYKQ